jgi:hypothetical protein
MQEPDDRLVGDLAWELFPTLTSVPEATRLRRFLIVIGGLLLVALTWLLSPTLAVVLACVGIAWSDVQAGRRLVKTVPDKTGGKICALFSYAWAALKAGTAAFVLFVVCIPIGVLSKDPPAGFGIAMLLWLGAFSCSAFLTAAGMVKALRSGMRIWIGRGVNQARTLFLAMLIVGFTFFVLMPMFVLLALNMPRPGHVALGIALAMLVELGVGLAGPVGMLLILDRICTRVLAERPGKFGPTVPTVGKWNT